MGERETPKVLNMSDLFTFMVKNWITELPKFLKKKYGTEDFNRSEIVSAISYLRNSQSNDVIMRAFRFLVQMNIICDIGGGRYLFDKTTLRAFTEGAKRGKSP